MHYANRPLNSLNVTAMPINTKTYDVSLLRKKAGEKRGFGCGICTVTLGHYSDGNHSNTIPTPSRALSVYGEGSWGWGGRRACTE